MRHLWLAATLMLAASGHPASLELKLGEVSEVLQATVETAAYRLTIDATRGARILSLLDKRLGADITRHDDTGMGGLFEDRSAFSTSQYAVRVVEDSPERIVLACSVRNNEGVALTKTYTFTEGQPVFSVRYELINGSQVPFVLWIRNFATAGAGEATEADRVFLRHGGRLQELTFPDGYFPDPDNPWFCLLDSEQQSGFFVRCDYDLLDRFYFWSGSRLVPTFEWIYKPVPPGMSTSTSLLFGTVFGLARVEHVDESGNALASATPDPEPRTEPVFTAVSGWRPVEELYGPTGAELQRGFIVTVAGTTPPKQRLSQLQVDLGLDERDAVPLEVFALAQEARVRGEVTGEVAAATTWRVEQDGWLADGADLTVIRGHYGRLWLMLDSRGLNPGEYQGQVTLHGESAEPVRLPLTVTVWNARLPQRPTFGTQMYAFLPTLSDYNLDEPARRRFLVYMDNLQALRVDSCEWAVAPYYPAMRATVRGRGELLTDWARAHPGASPTDLPDVDFRYYDLWFDECVQRGMTRFIAHVGAVNGWREGSLIQHALGRELDPNSEEGWQVVLWYYSQLREYARQKGFTSFWAKLDDEIPLEHIPAWNAAARRFQSIGYRTYTTNTGAIARSATLLNSMNETSDAWQVALCLSRDFMDLTRRSAAFEHRREVCDLRWGPYTNGGAVDTWATLVPFFAGDRPAERVDEIQVFADGVPLTMRDGSGWGNKDRGVAHVWAGHPYVSLPDGGDPNKARIEIAYRLRTTSEGGTPPVQIKPGAEVWYYGGGNYRQPYEAARAYAWRVCAFRMDGYGYWTYLWWNQEDILVKLNPDTYELAVSAAWEGLRDGNEDADYFRMAEARLRDAPDEEGLRRLRAVFAPDEGAPLRMGEVRSEVFAWDDFLQPTFAAYNQAKRAALQVLATP